MEHYNKTIGPLDEKSIPDGCVIEKTNTVKNTNKLHLLSTFRMSKIIEGYVCRKVQKLIQVAVSEYNTDTSLFYNEYPELSINDIDLYFYIWLPESIHVNKIKNVIKKIYKNIETDIPSIINLKFNILQTHGMIEKKCWYSPDGICFSIRHSTHKMRKLKTIYDIKITLELFNIENIDFYLSETFFADY